MKREVFSPGMFRYLPKWKDHQICLPTLLAHLTRHEHTNILSPVLVVGRSRCRGASHGDVAGEQLLQTRRSSRLHRTCNRICQRRICRRIGTQARASASHSCFRSAHLLRHVAVWFDMTTRASYCMERTGAGRSRYLQFRRQWRPAPAAHARRSS
jgi:hypothetical protein